MSAAKKGAGNPNHGQRHSDEAKAKMSAARFNTGKAVYLIQVSPSGLKVVSRFLTNAGVLKG